MMNIFTAVQASQVPRARFDLSHNVTQSMKMGQVVPVYWETVLPGDSFRLGSVNMLRFAPLIAPVMHKIRVSTRYFFVPHRLLWPEWKLYMGNNTESPHPSLNLRSLPCEKGSLANYLGIPVSDFTGMEDNTPISAFPFAAYNLIWDEYYRSQQLQNPVFTELIAGDNSITYNDAFAAGSCLPVGWRHDYLTSALPDAQFGDVVTLPLTFQNGIEVYLDQNGSTVFDRTGFWVNEDGSPPGAGNVQSATTGPTPVAVPGAVQINSEYSAYNPNGTLKVDVNSNAANIRDLRLAFRLQEWQEMLARGGTRYTEVLRMHFGVISSDGRMQRPEYIGGFTNNVVISEVLATAQSNNDAETAEIPVGYMAGHAISADGGQTFSFRAEEFGILMCLVTVMPDPSYMDGLNRQWFVNDQLDYPWPKFGNIGEQGIFNGEVFANTANPKGIWGYIPRYAEYKSRNNRVAGDFADDLSYWHMARKFTSLPPLNADFIKGDPTKRIFAVTDEGADEIYCMIQHRISAVRPLPRFGVPTI